MQWKENRNEDHRRYTRAYSGKRTCIQHDQGNGGGSQETGAQSACPHRTCPGNAGHMWIVLFSKSGRSPKRSGWSAAPDGSGSQYHGSGRDGRPSRKDLPESGHCSGKHPSAVLWTGSYAGGKHPRLCGGNEKALCQYHRAPGRRQISF